jgi:hypothetical protein
MHSGQFKKNLIHVCTLHKYLFLETGMDKQLEKHRKEDLRKARLEKKENDE